MTTDSTTPRTPVERRHRRAAQGWNAVSKALDDVAAERARQIESEGWDSAHDDEHDDGSLAAAAACYALPAKEMKRTRLTEVEDVAMRGEGAVWANVTRRLSVPKLWPKSWHPSWWKPKDRRRDLVRAGALILAEIERLDRLDAQRKEGTT